jgi:hypothetical protein
MPDIALGLQDHGLEEFAASVGAIHMGQWVDFGLYDVDEIDGSWGRAFELTLTRVLEGGGRFHFNLTGLNIGDALKGDLVGLGAWAYGMGTSPDSSEGGMVPEYAFLPRWKTTSIGRRGENGNSSACGHRLRRCQMGRADNELITQVGSKGYFGKVTVEAEPLEGNGEVAVDFEPTIPKRWRSGASFGIEYVLENIAKRKLFPKGGRIRVLYIGGHEVDTNNVVIAFVAAGALLKALGIQPSKQPSFDEKTGSFSFPK